MYQECSKWQSAFFEHEGKSFKAGPFSTGKGYLNDAASWCVRWFWLFRGARDLSTPTSGVMSPVTLPRAVVMFVASASVMPRPRIVVDRKGRGVRVEVRRARAAGQLEMPL